MFVEWPVDPRHLVTLAQVVRLGSFAAAADSLGYTQSAVSQQIGELERRVGERVVERRPVRVTAAGEVLLVAERRMQATMASVAAELDAITSGVTGQVRLGAFISAGRTFVARALAHFRAAHPGVHIILRELDLTADAYDAVLQREVDLAVTFDYDDTPLAVPLGIHRRFLRHDPLVVAMAEGHPLAARTEIEPSAIEGSIATRVLNLLAPERRPSRSALDFVGGDFATALELVAHGLGVVVLPELALTRAPAGVVYRPLTGRRSGRSIYLCRIESTRQTVPLTRLEACLTAAITPEPERDTQA
jgi:DNA-binding transcriptional LysR family regulator